MLARLLRRFLTAPTPLAALTRSMIYGGLLVLLVTAMLRYS